MKTLQLIGLAMILFIALNAGCSKDDTSNNIIDLSGTMSALVNGELMDFEMVYPENGGLHGIPGAMCENRFYRIFGSVHLNHKITLWFVDTLEVGTYYHSFMGEYRNFNENKIYYQKNWCEGAGGDYIDYGGLLRITSRDEHRIKGTFQFNAKTNKFSCEPTDDSIQVREGKFDVSRVRSTSHPLCDEWYPW